MQASAVATSSPVLVTVVGLEDLTALLQLPGQYAALCVLRGPAADGEHLHTHVHWHLDALLLQVLLEVTHHLPEAQHRTAQQRHMS